MTCVHQYWPSPIADYQHCSRCGTYHSLTAPEPKAIYAKDYWNGTTRSTLRDQDYNISKHLENGLTKSEFLFNLIWTQDRSSALEIGCAPGTLLRMLKYEAGFERVVGVDVDRSCEEVIRDIGQHQGELRFGLFPAVYEKRKAEEFSFILAVDVFEHVHEPVPFLESCHRLLKPDGQLLMAMPLVAPELPKRFFEPVEHVFIHSKEHMIELCNDAGFEPKFDQWTIGHDTVSARRL